MKFDVRTPFTWCDGLPQNYERVLKGDNVAPDMSLSVRELIERFTAGVPAVGKYNLDYDADPESVFDADYVFPDMPEFSDYVYADYYISHLNARLAEEKAAQAAADENVDASAKD